jgi:hypothetical protein
VSIESELEDQYAIQQAVYGSNDRALNLDSKEHILFMNQIAASGNLPSDQFIELVQDYALTSQACITRD